MRHARELNKRIKIYELSKVSDGFGGFTVAETYLTEVWAYLKTFNVGNSYAKNKTDFGISESSNALIVTVRMRSDFTYSENYMIEYAGEKYKIYSEPTNVDVKNKFVQFIIVKNDT